MDYYHYKCQKYRLKYFQTRAISRGVDIENMDFLSNLCNQLTGGG